MLKFIIRLDDACINMNEDMWIKVEKLLDKYNIKPIVGVIPDNKDLQIQYGTIKDFYNKYPLKWQQKGWTIALHGCYHKYIYQKHFFKKIRTEFFGKPYEEQKKLIMNGYNILKKQGVNPMCFFAPNHTFDKTTIKVCKNLGYFKFISDGYAYYPYKSNGMLFLPSVFDTPHKISKNGIFTFVYHPNTITEEKLKYLEEFIIKNRENFTVDINNIIDTYSNRTKNIKDFLLQKGVNFYRKIIQISRGNKNGK